MWLRNGTLVNFVHNFDSYISTCLWFLNTTVIYYENEKLRKHGTEPKTQRNGACAESRKPSTIFQMLTRHRSYFYCVVLDLHASPFFLSTTLPCGLVLKFIYNLKKLFLHIIPIPTKTYKSSWVNMKNHFHISQYSNILLKIQTLY